MMELKVSDIGEASALHCDGVSFLRAENEKGRISFVFDDVDNIASDTLRRHRNGELNTCTLDFLTSMTTMRNVLRSEMGR